mmetsp:Transcript_8286/g.13861  ORF Transcript_8286/g.13861 Transcript_8286/m.13861 type:complete len:93 (-) Transcript_8286:74-352(-)
MQRERMQEKHEAQTVNRGNDVDQFSYIEELKQRMIFENLPELVTKCTQECVVDYSQMYLSKEEEVCTKSCYLKAFQMQNHLNQEISFLIRNL